MVRRGGVVARRGGAGAGVGGGVALDDAVEGEVRRLLHEGDVEDLGREAEGLSALGLIAERGGTLRERMDGPVADDADVERVRSHGCDGSMIAAWERLDVRARGEDDVKTSI